MRIVVNNLSFGYDKLNIVLKNITISLLHNETIAVVGPSGCGKSTLLRLLCGIIKKEKRNYFEGNIKVNDSDPDTLIKAKNIGFMFQEPALFPNINVYDNIALPIKLNHKKQFKAVVDSMINNVGLTSYHNYYPSQLSGGMKTRVSLARTFITKPELLLLDEPFSSLDIKWKYTLYRELDSLINEYNPMTIFVTHDIQEALLLSNHIFVLSKVGSIIKEIILQKKLPRVYDEDSVSDLRSEYLEILNLIMKESLV